MVQSKVLDEIENNGNVVKNSYSTVSKNYSFPDFFKYFLSGKETEPPTLALSDQIRKLSEGLETINSELQSQIRLQNPTLLKNAVSGNRLNKNLNTLSSEFQKLQERMGVLKKQINDPYESMETHIKVLERLHNSSHLLRNVSSFLQLYKNLQSESSSLEQQAHILFEMESLIEDKDLGKIHMIQEEKSNAISTKQRLLHIANRDLNSGLQNNNENQIVKSLQIYSNLNSLDQHLKNLSDTYINDIRESIRQIFNGIDLQTIQKTSIKVTAASSTLQSQNKVPGKVPTLSTSFHFWTKLLAGLDWLFTDELFSYCEQALLLQRCLKKVSSNFLSEQNSKDFVSKFSHSLSALLQESFTEAPIHVSQAIQQNLPKLLGSFNTLKNKLDKEFVLSKNIFSSLDVGYIEKIAGNMKVPLISAEVLNEEVIDGVLKSAAEEINVALIDDDLCLSVIDVFIACNQNFWSKVKSNIKYGTDSAQVLGIPNSVQIQNTNYCNLVYHHQIGLELLIHNLDLQNKNQKAFEKLKKNLIEGKAITTSVLKQLIDSMVSAITIIFLSMHREPSLNTLTISVSTASMYMREFQEFLTRTWSSHIANFNDKVSVNSW